MIKKLFEFGKTEKYFGIFTCLTFNTMKKIHLKQVYGKETKTGAGFLNVDYYNNNCFKKINLEKSGCIFPCNTCSKQSTGLTTWKGI